MKQTFLYLVSLALCVVGLTACSDNDSEGQPVITSVRLTNPEKADSTFTQAERGTMLLIQGENLDGVQHAYINGQEVSFNSTYNTSTHLILTVPFDLDIVNPVTREIMLVTNHGTAVYAFRIVGPKPELYEYKAEWGRDADGNRRIVGGQDLHLIGANFYDVEHIYLADNEDGSGNHYEVTDYTISNTQSEIILKMPQSFPSVAWFFVECYQGSASLKFTAQPSAPEITAISSDMPVEGETVIIYGRNFIDISGIEIGGTTIAAADITINDDANELTFTMPAAPTEGGTLTLISENGRKSINFYDYTMMISDFDNHSSGWFSWGGQHVTQNDGQHVPANRSGNIHGIEGKPGAWSWWWGQLYFGGFTLPTAIPADTPIDDIELRFEYYIGAEIDNGPQFRMYLSNDESTMLENFVPTDHLTGENRVGHWMTFACPLASFTNVKTYGQYKFSGDFAMQCLNPSDNGDAEVIFYIDNIRLHINK